MLCTVARPLYNSLPTTAHLATRRRLPLSGHRLPLSGRRVRRLSLSSSQTRMSSETIEHIVLFNVKDSTDQSQLTSMVNGLNGLRSLDMVLHLTAGPIHRNNSTSLKFTHILHSRYQSKDDLARYSAHPAHLDVVRGTVLPICDDIMAVDWVAARDLEGPVSPKPGSAMRVQFVKLKEGLGDQEKEKVFEVIGGLKEKVNGIEQISFGENFSPARAKGFSIASIGVFSGLSELDSVEQNLEIEKEKDKVRDLIDSLVIVDYVIPSVQSSSSL